MEFMYTVDGVSHPIEINSHLDFATADYILNNVVENAYIDGKRSPIREYCCFWALLLKECTNYDGEFTFDEIYHLLYHSDLINQMRSNEKFSMEIDDLMHAIDIVITNRVNEHPLKKVANDLHEAFLQVQEMVASISEDETKREVLTEFLFGTNGEKRIKDLFQSRK